MGEIKELRTAFGYVPADVVINLMDDEIRGKLHEQYADEVTEQQFYDLYCVEHEKKYGELFCYDDPDSNI